MSIKQDIGEISKQCISKSSTRRLADTVSIHLRGSVQDICDAADEIRDSRHKVKSDPFCDGYTRALLDVMGCYHDRLVNVEKCHYEEGVGYPSNRCQRPADHEGDHSLSKDTGFVKAKWERYWECGGCGKDIGPNPGSCTACGYVTCYYKEELHKMKMVETI